MTLQETIKYIRKELGLSQAEMAKQVGIAQNMISRFESGLTDDPRLETIKKLEAFVKKHKLKVSFL